MTDKKTELSTEEIEAQNAEELPDREEMSLINANAAVPVNAAGPQRAVGWIRGVRQRAADQRYHPDQRLIGGAET